MIDRTAAQALNLDEDSLPSAPIVAEEAITAPAEEPLGIQFGESGVLQGAYTQVTELPSGFKAYPQNAQILYRPYNYQELDDYNDSMVLLSEGYRFILGGIEVRNMRREDITLGDFLYIALLRKLSSLGTQQFTVSITHGAERYSKVYTFEDIEFSELLAPNLPVSAVIAGVKMVFKPLTIGQFISLCESKLQDNERALMAAQCINLPFKDARQLIDGAMGDDLFTLHTVDQYLTHSIKPLEISYTHQGRACNSRVDIDDPLSIVAPFRGQEEPAGNTIRFGV